MAAFGSKGMLRARLELLEHRWLLAAAPVAVDDKYTVLAGEMLVNEPGVLANDYDADGDEILAVLVGMPEHGAISLSADGGFRYVPKPGFWNDVDTFQYRAVAADGESDVTLVTINVQRPTTLVYWSTVVGGNGHAYGNVSAPDAGWTGSREQVERLTLGGSTGHLATLTSQAEYDWTIAQGIVGNQTYLGGYQDSAAADYSEPRGGWRWITGEPWDYTAWGFGEPNDWGPGEDFLQAWGTFWNDIWDEVSFLDSAVEFPDPMPIAMDSLVVVQGDSSYRVQFSELLADGLLLDPGSTIEILAPPLHGLLQESDAAGTTYVPTLGFTGRDALDFRIVTPRGPSSAARLWFKVGFDEFAPQARSENYWVNEDSVLDTAAAGKASVLANDFDADSGALFAILATPPEHGDFAFSPNGHFTYAPDRNYSGADYFWYQVSDGWQISAPVRVGLAIDGLADPPVAKDDAYEFSGAWPFTVEARLGVLANDVDPDYPPLAILNDPPSHGTLTLNDDGSFSYSPLAGFFGIDRFTYHANDYVYDSNQATVLLAVDVIFGDANGDGLVNLDDFGALKANFGQTDASLAQGDLDGDDSVDLDDFGLLKANFGRAALGVDGAVLDLAATGAWAIAPLELAAGDVRALGWLRWAWELRNGKPEADGER